MVPAKLFKRFQNSTTVQNKNQKNKFKARGFKSNQGFYWHELS